MRLLLAIFAVATLPFSTFATVVITEIMYDPKDIDAQSGGEWIEIQNTGSGSIDLTKWIFFENDTNHSIIADSIPEIPPGSYAVISRDLTAFKNYFTGFTGPLFKASFSLNDGEYLAMKSGKESPIADSVTYTSEWGAKNDGNSLQKSGVGSFVAALPTPGSGAAGTSVASSGSSAPLAPSSSPGPAIPVEPQVFVNAGPDKVTVAGADVIFEGKAHGLEQKPLENARYIWNFGDGTTKEGKQVSHVYRYPGDYVVVLDVALGYFAGSDRLKVTVENSKVFISSLGDGSRRFVELRNDSAHELDISGWMLKEGNTLFTIPERTYIGGNKKLVFPSEVTMIPAGNDVSLLYPSGTLADRYAPGRTATVLKKESNPAPSLPVVEKAAISPAANAAAAVGTDMTDEEWPSIYKWLLGVFALALVAIAGVFLLPRMKEKPENKLSADDFKIIEEK